MTSLVSSASPIHLTGPILTRDGTRDEAWVIDGRITFSRPDRPTTSIAGWAMVGLADAHCHIGHGPDGATSREQALDDARAVLTSGVTAVRDLGTPQDMEWIDRQPDVPRILHCGQHLARHKRYVRGLGREIEPHDLPAAAADEARRSDGWVKIVGDWIDRSGGADSDLAPLWPREVLMDAVSAIHDAGCRAAIHTFSREVAEDAITAGFDSIEHGTGLTPDGLAECHARGIVLTPTMRQYDLFDTFADQAGSKYPVYAEHMRSMWERRTDWVADVVDSGVDLLMGSDAGGFQPFGQFPAELARCVEAGFPVERVIDAAAWGGRARMDVRGTWPRDVVEGGVADVVVVNNNPYDDITTFQNPVAVIAGRE